VTDFEHLPESAVTMPESLVTMPEWRRTAQWWCYAFCNRTGTLQLFDWNQRARTKDQYA
jgi:hypothetical protein